MVFPNLGVLWGPNSTDYTNCLGVYLGPPVYRNYFFYVEDLPEGMEHKRFNSVTRSI